jgi:hypothetical protein
MIDRGGKQVMIKRNERVMIDRGGMTVHVPGFFFGTTSPMRADFTFMAMVMSIISAAGRWIDCVLLYN